MIVNTDFTSPSQLPQFLMQSATLIYPIIPTPSVTSFTSKFPEMIAYHLFSLQYSGTGQAANTLMFVTH